MISMREMRGRKRLIKGLLAEALSPLSEVANPGGLAVATCEVSVQHRLA